MPYLSIQTNQHFDAATTKPLIKQASLTIAELLAKPEKYIMVAVPPPVPMLFAGSDAPAAYLELKSIGLPPESTATLSRALCILVNERLGIAKDRIYIEFANAEPRLWGWNGQTF